LMRIDCSVLRSQRGRYCPAPCVQPHKICAIADEPRAFSVTSPNFVKAISRSIGKTIQKEREAAA
jgi:hypothetical protein